MGSIVYSSVTGHWGSRSFVGIIVSDCQDQAKIQSKMNVAIAVMYTHRDHCCLETTNGSEGAMIGAIK